MLPSVAGPVSLSKPLRRTPDPSSRRYLFGMPNLVLPEDAAPARQPTAVRLQIVTPSPAPPDSEGWLHEIKHDGHRLIAIVDACGRLSLISRNGYDRTEAFGAPFAPLAAAGRALVIDGEIAVPDDRGVTHLDHLNDAISRREPHRLAYYAFDLLHIDGHDLRRCPIEQRKDVLRQVLDEVCNDNFGNGLATIRKNGFGFWGEADAAVGPEGVADVLVGHLAVEPFGVEVTAGPAFGVAVLGIVGVGNDVEESGIAMDAADILGRPGAGAVNATGGARRQVEGEQPLELDDMLPVVAEVVDVKEAEALAAVEVAQAHLALVEAAGVVFELGLADLCIAVRQAADAELVQVIIPPAEGGLNDAVQLTEMNCAARSGGARSPARSRRGRRGSAAHWVLASACRRVCWRRRQLGSRRVLPQSRMLPASSRCLIEMAPVASCSRSKNPREA